MKFDWKKTWPYVGAMLLFVVLTLVYFSPLLSGQAIQQGDVAHFKGMSQEIVQFREQEKAEPLWTNAMFSGMPAYQISVYYPSNLIRPLTTAFGLGIIPHPATIVFLAFAGFFFLLLTLGAGVGVSVIGAIAFGLSSYTIIIIEAGHNPKGYAIAYMAPVLAGVLMTLRGRLWLGAGITALALCLELSVNHLQITYYLALAMGFVVVGEAVRLIREKNLTHLLKSIGVLALAAGLAVGPNLTNLLLTEEYGRYSTRGKSELTADKSNKTTGLDKDYATQWSYGVGETFSLLVPNFKGGSSGRISDDNQKALEKAPADYREYIGNLDQYWGNQPFTSGPVYFGAITCFLFVLGLFFLRDQLKWYLLGAVVLTVMLAWGKNFMGLTDFFMDHIPGYNKFRAVSMTLVVAQLLVPFIGALTLAEVMRNPERLKTEPKPFYYSVGITAGLCLLFWLMPGMFQDFYKENEYADLSKQLKEAQLPADQIPVFLGGLSSVREAIFKADAMRSLLFIVAAAGILWLYSRKTLNQMLALGILGILVLADLWAVDKRYLNASKFVPKSQMDVPYEPSQADQQILQDKDPDFRVLNTTVSPFNDASTSYFHKSIGGYHGAKLKRYQELWDEHMSKNNRQVLNMLNTKYFIVQPQAQGQQAQGAAPMAMPNPEACGNAWFVPTLSWVPNADAEIKALGNFNPKKIAFADQRFKEKAGALPSAFDSTGAITLSQYKANALSYTSRSSTGGVAVFSEIYYDKGWEATVDGKPADYFRVNYVLRGMVLPAGEHRIEWKFTPAAYTNGERLSMVSSIALYLFLALGFWLDRKQRKTPHVA